MSTTKPSSSRDDDIIATITSLAAASSSTTAQSQQSSSSSSWKEKLITKEDPMHLHKTLGIACLISFAWRFTQIGTATDMGFGTHPHFTLPTVCLHWLLSLSSLEFKIPQQRIKEGSRIWPEYRLHSICFASRSLAVMALYWFEEQTYYFNTLLQQPLYFANVVIVLATMTAADWATASQKHSSKSIRELDISRVTSYFFSVCQFYATAGVLFGLPRGRYSIQFVNVFVVQLNPFVMTLRRKNLISHYATVTIYGFMLVFGFFVCVYEYTLFGVSMLRTVAAVGNIAILWRTSPIFPTRFRRIVQNKYLIWTVLGVVVQYIRPLATMEMSTMRKNLYTTGFALVWLNGYIKCTTSQQHNGSTNTSSSTSDDDSSSKRPIKKFV